jgi:hypothetical protein
VVESSALLKRRTPKGYRGFESLPHRHVLDLVNRAPPPHPSRRSSGDSNAVRLAGRGAQGLQAKLKTQSQRKALDNPSLTTIRCRLIVERTDGEPPLVESANHDLIGHHGSARSTLATAEPVQAEAGWTFSSKLRDCGSQSPTVKATRERRPRYPPESLLFLPLGRSVSLFHCFSFGYVFALLGLAVKPRAFLMINMRFGIYPNKTMSTPWRCCGPGGGFRCGLSGSRGRRYRRRRAR